MAIIDSNERTDILQKINANDFKKLKINASDVLMESSVYPENTSVETAVASKLTAISSNNPGLLSIDGVCTWTITHTYTAVASCRVIEMSTNSEIITDITYGTGQVIIKFKSTSDIAANTFKATILG